MSVSTWASKQEEEKPSEIVWLKKRARICLRHPFSDLLYLPQSCRQLTTCNLRQRDVSLWFLRTQKKWRLYSYFHCTILCQHLNVAQEKPVRTTDGSSSTSIIYFYAMQPCYLFWVIIISSTLHLFDSAVMMQKCHKLNKQSITAVGFTTFQGVRDGKRWIWWRGGAVGKRAVQTLWTVPHHRTGKAHPLPPPVQSPGRTGRGWDPQLHAAGLQSKPHK